MVNEMTTCVSACGPAERLNPLTIGALVSNGSSSSSNLLPNRSPAVLKSDEMFSKNTSVSPDTCVDRRPPLKAAYTSLVSDEPKELRKARFIVCID